MSTIVPYRLIQRKRDGGSLQPDELRGLLRAYGDGDLPDYQMAAFLMAVYFNGMDPAELSVLVDTMMASGAVVDFGGLPGRRVDKHSTGGVGDKVSIVLAPLVASRGVQVPMMSGRGLGHTGGTVDKLESIPGFRTALSLSEFRDQLERIGCALISQTDEITPLDGRLYALRDVTATVESIPLIASSIMSKKLAEGIDALVLDVKRGSGAFIQELDRALELASTMVAIGGRHGRDVVALVTAMDRPLGRAVGNAIETAEAIDALRGGGPPDLREVTVALAAEMLVLGGASATLAEGREAAETALDDGSALRMMERIIEVQGGDPGVLEDPGLLPSAPVDRVLEAEAAGFVHGIEPRALGEAVVELGGGRETLDSTIDPAVGFVLAVAPGVSVEPGQPLGRVLARSDADAVRGLDALKSAIAIGPSEPPDPLPLVSHRVTADGMEEVG